ncbi:MAG: T9SS type A sorting domain-containing protein [Ignavibacteria bacterium]|nr:T9SS type A sorting domain-containing protein [Ignavibacteria bacterium]
MGVPNKFKLSQNYPNPFNPSTRIDFALPNNGNVILKIYDLTGKEVETIVNDFRTAGYYTINFNASNLASGIYYYKLTAGNDIAVNKMVVVK